LSVGAFEVDIAVILVHYAVLFLCVLPFIGLQLKILCAWSAAWVLGSPLVAFLLRPWLMATHPPLQLDHNPAWQDLATPGQLLSDLFLTGYYPVLQWLSYLLVGLVIGRLALTAPGLPLLLLVGGTALAVFAKVLGTLAMEKWGGLAALQSILVDPSFPLGSLLQVNLSGVRQEGSWWWLASSAPHSGTTLDLLHTIGTAAAVLGLCLLIGRLADRTGLDLLLPLRGAGAMTLTLYTLHVWAVASIHLQGWTEEAVYFAHAALAVLIGMAFVILRIRGPLEWLGHAANQVGRGVPDLSTKK
jgi:hypothetical protein